MKIVISESIHGREFEDADIVVATHPMNADIEITNCTFRRCSLEAMYAWRCGTIFVAPWLTVRGCTFNGYRRTDRPA